MEYKIKGKCEEVVHHVDLWLVRNIPDSPIELKARHSSWPEGEANHILRIRKDGTLKMSLNVSEELGFKLDAFKRIMVE